MVQGQQMLMLDAIIVPIAFKVNVSGYKILCFLANLQKYQNINVHKNSHYTVRLLLYFVLCSRELGSKGDPPLLLPQLQVAEAKDISGMYVCIYRKLKW